jgi:hypothetical protein
MAGLAVQITISVCIRMDIGNRANDNVATAGARLQAINACRSVLTSLRCDSAGWKQPTWLLL